MIQKCDHHHWNGEYVASCPSWTLNYWRFPFHILYDLYILYIIIYWILVYNSFWTFLQDLVHGQVYPMRREVSLLYRSIQLRCSTIFFCIMKVGAQVEDQMAHYSIQTWRSDDRKWCESHMFLVIIWSHVCVYIMYTTTTKLEEKQNDMYCRYCNTPWKCHLLLAVWAILGSDGNV